MIVLRGSQPIVAFGIGFIPSVVVILTIVAGKQLAQGESHALGCSSCGGFYSPESPTIGRSRDFSGAEQS